MINDQNTPWISRLSLIKQSSPTRPLACREYWVRCLRYPSRKISGKYPSWCQKSVTTREEEELNPTRWDEPLYVCTHLSPAVRALTQAGVSLCCSPKALACSGSEIRSTHTIKCQSRGEWLEWLSVFLSFLCVCVCVFWIPWSLKTLLVSHLSCSSC